MDQTEAPTPRPTPPDPSPDRSSPTIPERIATLLQIVRVLLGHGRRLAVSATAGPATPQFATVAAVLGTYNVPIILARLQRGILRLIALETYLLARAKKGRDIALVLPPLERLPSLPRDEPDPASAPRPRAQKFDPDALRVPTLAELEAEVRRCPVGRTIAYVCMDLAVVPGFCTGAFWNDLFETLRDFGGSLSTLYAVRGRREKSFQREREQRPETWDWDWRDLRPPSVRQALGSLIGEAPMLDPPGSVTA